MNKSYVLGIDMGGTNFRMGLVDDGFNVVKFEKLPVEEVLKSEDVIEDLSICLRAFIEDLSIEAIAIGLPAPLDKQRRVVLQTPNLPNMNMLPLAELLSERMGIPTIMERDVNMIMCYDMSRYNIPPHGVACGFYFGTGIGNAIFVEGKAYTGRNGAAGELGHIPVDGCREQCGCGNVGCMENLAGGKFLKKNSLNFVENKAALNGFIDRMAQAVATELNILDPDHVIIGGGVLELEEFPQKFFVDRLLKRCRKPYPAENLNIIFAEEHPHKGVLGAAMYYKKTIVQQ